ncbi:Bax inhibitor-1/YccA family protein [Formicincola oecophyllae]|uniref:Bax inhibitor-1/YccA family protein n=2 Tax=Formicincola oecophyllae TaxID=2558361 RepID=A0A4Y6UAL0_9PROT|nr:Bax inhibitor-1/YccA family protein [Formicincola oecophyllae]
MAQPAAVPFDEGLRLYLVRVFNWMAAGLALTGLTSWAVIHTSLAGAFFKLVMTQGGLFPVGLTGLGWVAVLAPLAFVLVLSFGLNRLSRQAVQGLFLLFSVVMGVSMASLVMCYTGVSVARTFFVCAALYAAVAFWGYTTKRSLASMGSFLFMGMIGLLIAMVVNLIWPSGMMSMVISCVGVVLFTAFTAYDMQSIKIGYQEMSAVLPPDELGKRSVYDALSLYLDFINLFQFLLSLMGQNSSSSNNN